MDRFLDEEALSKGIFNAYTHNNLRYSQNAPLPCMRKKYRLQPSGPDRTLCNRRDAYHFLFIAKGGGSANKTYLYQETKRVDPENLIAFMKEKMKTLERRPVRPIIWPL